MSPTNVDNELDDALKERFDKLPKVIQNAITSADVEKRMRELADTHKLHIDQWQALENEVMLTLLGVQPIEDLERNLKTEVNVSSEIAGSLASDISKIVFEPIRAELERELEQSGAQAATSTPTPAAIAPAVLPATPPTEAPTVRIERAPVSAAYKAGETSTVRKSVEDDPYREPPA